MCAGFAAAEGLRARLADAGEDRDVARVEFDRLRRELVELCGLSGMRRLDVVFPASATDLHLIAATYATHKTPAVKRWTEAHPRFHLHFTPTSASWLNLVERWFAGLTEKQLRRGVHRSTAELEDAIRGYLELNNRHPKPFVWTKTAEEILNSLARYLQ